jgi:hypothetical protein
MLPFPKPKETKDSVVIPMSDPVPQPGGRKRRASRRRGGFRTQDVNSASPVPPTGPQGPLGGRRRTRKHKGRKHHTRRRH